jgi:hypothetical protein
VARHPDQQRRVALYDDLSDRAVLEQHLAVNLFGPYAVTQAFLPHLSGSRGAIVNNVSMMALTPFPLTPAYAVSKAAAFNLTQSLRALAGRGITVHAVLTGPTDTDMTRGFEIPKASPESVAHAILDGVERADEDIFPDPTPATVATAGRRSLVTGRCLERGHHRQPRGGRHRRRRQQRAAGGGPAADPRPLTVSVQSRDRRSVGPLVGVDPDDEREALVAQPVVMPRRAHASVLAGVPLAVPQPDRVGSAVPPDVPLAGGH